MKNVGKQTFEQQQIISEMTHTEIWSINNKSSANRETAIVTHQINSYPFVWYLFILFVCYLGRTEILMPVNCN